MPSRRWLLAVLPITLVLGCRRAPAPANVFPEERSEPEFPQGIFYYRVKALGDGFHGRIVIADTVVIMEPAEGACRGQSEFVGASALPPGIVAVRGSENRWRKGRVTFYCDLSAATAGKPGWTGAVVTVVVDRRSPLTHSEWGRQAIDVTGGPGSNRAICVDPSGAREAAFCARSTPVHTTRWSKLEVRREPFAPPDSGSEATDR